MSTSPTKTELGAWPVRFVSIGDWSVMRSHLVHPEDSKKTACGKPIVKSDTIAEAPCCELQCDVCENHALLAYVEYNAGRHGLSDLDMCLMYADQAEDLGDPVCHLLRVAAYLLKGE